jgi:hypothetical protein
VAIPSLSVKCGNWNKVIEAEMKFMRPAIGYGSLDHKELKIFQQHSE